MHNNRIKVEWLAALVVLVPWLAWAQVPPPIVRNVLDTNLVSFGSTGQALFRTTALPFINWSNILQAVGITNVINSIVGTSNNLYILKLNGVGTNLTVYVNLTVEGNLNVSTNLFVTNNAVVSGWLSQVGGTNYGDGAKTNWTTTGPSGFLNTNVAGGYVSAANGDLVISSNLSVGRTIILNTIAGTNMGISVVSSNIMIFGSLSNNVGPGMTETNLILDNLGNVGIGRIPTVALHVSGSATISGTLSGSSVNASTRFRTGSGAGNVALQPAAFMPSSFQLTSGDGSTPGPSNNLFIAGQCIASNGMVAKIHSTYGPSTNIVPLTVIPNAGGAQNFMEVYGTNGSTLVHTVNSNGVTSVHGGGELNQIGCYGSLMMNATNIVVCAGASSVYTNVAGTGFTTIVTNGFYGAIAGNSAALTNLQAGWYRGSISLSGLGANNQAIEAELFTNGVACDLISFKKTYDAAARMDTMSASGIIYLPSGCRTDFRVQDAGTGGSIAIHRASLTLGTP